MVSPRLLKLVAFVLATVPLALLLLDAFGVGGRTLGANPVEALLHRAGWWGLVLLLVTLVVTPARDLSGVTSLIRIRRLLGLYAFFYLALHVLVYTVLDQRLALGPIVEDIIKRPYITLGLAAFVLLVPLAVTSNDASRRRLKKRWTRLHQLIYPIAILGVWHYWWQVKKDVTEPLIFAVVLSALLGYRLHKRRRTRTPPRVS